MKNVKKVFHPVAKEFRVQKCGFNHGPMDDFIRSQWQQHTKSIAYLMYRWIVALFFAGLVLATLILQFINGKFFIYFTNWGILMCTVTNLMGAILVTVWYLNPTYLNQLEAASYTDPVPLSLKIYWALHTTTLSVSLVVTVIYWSLLYPMQGPGALDVINIFLHAFNSILMVLDIIIVAFPVRIFHIYLPLIFACCYGLFSIIYYFSGGTDPFGNHFVYPILDWSKPGQAVMTVVEILALLCIISFLCFILFKIRTFIYTRCYNTKQNFKLDIRPSSIENQGYVIEVPRTSL